MILINQPTSTKKSLYKLTTADFIQKAVEVHKDKYNYDSVIYTKSTNKVKIYCNHHKVFFEQRAAEHLFGKGCKKCKADKISSIKRMKITEFIDRAIEIHGDKYNYDSVVYNGSHSKVKIYCNHHQEFFYQLARDHLNDHGCPQCARESRVSKQCSKWLNSLNIDSLIPEYQIKSSIHNRRFVVDGFDPATNTIYLYHGDYWHGNLNRYSSDTINVHIEKTMAELNRDTMIYESQLRELNYNLIVIWESDWMRQQKLLIS